MVGGTDSEVAEDFEEGPGGGHVESLGDDFFSFQSVGVDALQHLDAGGVDGDGRYDDGILAHGLFGTTHGGVVTELDYSIAGYGYV